jgi:hypothetical protein
MITEVPKLAFYSERSLAYVVNKQPSDHPYKLTNQRRKIHRK